MAKHINKNYILVLDGLCHDSTEYSHIKNGCPKCRDIFNGTKFHTGCRYRTYDEDYCVSDRNTVNETISISDSRLDLYQNCLIAHLNYNSLRQESVQKTVASVVDRIMSIHKNDKGIIHTTSYEQVRFIQKYISAGNRVRLIYTDPEKPREQVTAEHFISTRPTVLISPSLHTGLDLKHDRSRFQILVKVPFPNKGNRWINAKTQIDPGWYNWQTKLRLVQAYGRSIRSRMTGLRHMY